MYACFCGMYVCTVWLAMIKDSWLRYNIRGFTESTHAICGHAFRISFKLGAAKWHSWCTGGSPNSVKATLRPMIAVTLEHTHRGLLIMVIYFVVPQFKHWHSNLNFLKNVTVHSTECQTVAYQLPIII